MSIGAISLLVASGVGVIILLLILRLLWHAGSYFRDKR